MYRKTQIELIESSIIYLKYIVEMGYQIDVQIVNPDTLEWEYSLERVNSVTAALRTDQFSVDDDAGAIVLNMALMGKKAIIIYYTEGKINPFYASSNLHTFIAKVLKWSENRIIDGCYIHWDYISCGDDSPQKKIKEGSFVYDGRYYVYKGGYFDIRNYAPPTVIDNYRAYKFFINAEIISSYVDNRQSLLQQIGIIHSDSIYPTINEAKADLMGVYKNQYNSISLDICNMFIKLNSAREYDIWISYPSENRTL